MERSRKKIRKTIMRDCRRVMIPSTIIYIVQETAMSILTVFISSRLGHFFDSVINLEFQHGMKDIGILLVCVVIGVLVLPFGGFLGEAVMLSNALKHDRVILGHFLSKTYQSAMRIEEGEAQFRIENDPIELRCNWQEIIVKGVVAVVATAYLLHCALPLSVVFTLIVFGVSIMKLIVPIGIQKLNAKYDRENREYFTDVRVYENVITHSPWQVKLFGIKENILKSLDELYLKNYKEVQSKNIALQTVSKNVSEFLNQFCILVIMLAGVFLVAKGQITPGVITAMMGYFSVFNLIIENIGQIIKTVPVQNNVIERMELLYDNEEFLDGIELEEIQDIKTEALRFSYTEDVEFAINYTDIQIQAGSKTPLSGVNGSGKTSFLKLLCKLNCGYKGSIKMNGSELKDVSAKCLRNQISYIAQEPYLFSGSVLENIWIGNLKASKEEVIKASKQVGIEHLLDREVSAEKQNLSGGERQKIAIARALLKDGSVYLLDEPEKNLDTESIEWLKRFIKQMDKTMMYVTHDDRLACEKEAAVLLSK